MISVDTAGQYFDTVCHRWEQALALAGQSWECFVVVGSAVVKLVFTDRLLYDAYLPALGRVLLPEPPDSWDAEVRTWSASTKTDLPTPEWSESAHMPRGEIPSLSNEDIRSTYNIQSTVFNSFDCKSGMGFHCVRDVSSLPQYEHGAPLRDIFSWILLVRGEQMVHAGAVGSSSGGLLLAGRGGSGKSTTTTGCLGTTLKFVADDYCLLRNNGREIRVECLFDTFKLYPSDAQKNNFIGKLDSTYSAESGKKLYYIDESILTHTSRGFPLKAIVLPRIDAEFGAQTNYFPVSSAAAMRALAPSTLLQLPGAKARSFQLMASVVKDLPAYELRLGTSRERVSHALSRLLDEAT